ASLLQLGAAPLVAPSSPSGLTAAVAGAHVVLAWVAAAGGDAPSSYVVEAGSSSGRADLANFDTGSSAPSLAVDGVPAGPYYVRVRARNAAGVSAPSGEALVIVGTLTQCTPNNPTGLASSVAGTSLTLTWAPPGGTCAPTAYRIEAGSSSGGSEIAVVNTTTATTFSAAGVPRGTYFLRVRAVNGSSVSQPSNEVVATVTDGACAAPPAAPTGLAGSAVGTFASVTWNAAPGAISYVVEAGTASGLSNILVTETPSPSISGTAGVGLYFIRVRARNACGLSAPSGEIALA